MWDSTVLNLWLIKENKRVSMKVCGVILGEGALCLCPVNISALGLLLRDWQSWMCLDN